MAQPLLAQLWRQSALILERGQGWMQSLFAWQRKGCHETHALAGLGKLEESCKVVEHNQDSQLLKVLTLLPLKNGAVGSS